MKSFQVTSPEGNTFTVLSNSIEAVKAEYPNHKVEEL